MRDTRLGSLLANAQADLIGSWMSNGTFDFYDGERPQFPEDEPAGNLIGAITFRDPACLPAIDGVLVSYPIREIICFRPGRVAWARLRRADNKTIMDVSVGLTDANIVLNIIDWVPEMSSGTLTFTHQVPRWQVYPGDDGGDE